MIDGSLIDNIRYIIDRHYGAYGLPVNQHKRPAAIRQAISDDTEDLSVDRRPIINLLLKTPLDVYPNDTTIKRILDFIVSRGPSNATGPIIQKEWLHQPHDEDFKKKISEAFKEGQRFHDLELSSASPVQPLQQDANDFEDLAYFMSGLDYGKQDFAKSFVGNYLIFRHITSLKDWAVSYLGIYPPRQDGYPCWFRTYNPDSLETYSENGDTVCGVFFEPPTRPRLLHAIGRHAEKDGNDQWLPTLEIRSAYLRGARRPGINHGPLDILGVRLGPGRVYGEPRGYAMWCARLTEETSLDDLPNLVSQFSMSDLEKLDAYRPLVPSLDSILDWVSQQSYLSVRGNFKV